MKFDNKRILIVDDNQAIHEDFLKILKTNRSDASAGLDELERGLFGEDAAPQTSTPNIDYDVESAFQGEEALEKIRIAQIEGRPFAMCFMDVRMPPGWDGIMTISNIWKEFPYTEMVICTAFSDYSWDDIVNKLGSTDRLLFISKPFDATSVKQMALALTTKWNLGAEARSYVATLEKEVQERTGQLKELLAEVQKKNDELQYVAMHDALSGLPNRALFNDRLTHSIRCAQRDNQKFALMILDLNKFKEINDTKGHIMGDIVIQETSKRLASVLRKSDTVARLGGDEFAIILHNTNDEYCMMIADKIQQSINPPITAQNNTMQASASIGIAVFPDHGTDEITLYKNADIAMYQAKRSGVGQVRFNADEHAKQSDSIQLVRDLSDAIRDKKLELYYQPIIDVKNRKPVGVEALCRWKHPERGFVPPDSFISIAEQNNLIQPLTLWVLETAITQCAAWHNAGVKLTVAVNLSTRNFLDPQLATRVADCLRKLNLEAHWLYLEITESTTMSDPDRALEIINTINELGVQISIDDFGTGYSSLAYLKKLPVNELKIDRSFVMEMDKDNDSRAIVHSTIELAHTLGLKVVAEGIETESILQILSEMNCDMAQGYFMCKPKPAVEISQWLTTWKHD